MKIYRSLKEFNIHLSLLKPSTESFKKAFVILIIAVSVTALRTYNSYRSAENQSKGDFVSDGNDTQDKIFDVLHSDIQLLQSAAAYFTAEDSVTRSEWHEFVEHSKIDKAQNNALGVGYSMIISKSEIKQHIQKIKKEGFPAYTIKPAGERPFYTTVIYLEPFSGTNLKVFGYDNLTDPVRRKAIEMARDSNMITLTGKVLLLQQADKNSQTGILMFAPVYKKGMAINTIEQRRAAIKGWVYAAYRMNDLMQNAFRFWSLIKDDKIHLKIYDDSISARSLMYENDKSRTLNSKNVGEFSNLDPISFNGVKWIFQFTQPHQKTFFTDTFVLVNLLGGLVISLILFLLMLSLYSSGDRARQMAAHLTIELKENKERLELVLKGSNDAPWDWDLLTQTPYYYPQWWSQLGYVADEFLYEGNDPWRKLVHPEDIGNTDRLFKTALDSDEEGYEIEYRLLHKNGNYLTMLSRGFITRDANGVPVRVSGSDRDLTERKRAENALRLSEEKFRLITENVIDVIWVLNYNQKRFTYISPSVLNLHGFTVEEAMDQGVNFFKPGNSDLKQLIDSIPEHIKIALEPKNTDKSFLSQIQLPCKNGDFIWVEISTRYRINSDGEIEILGVTRDIEERKRLDDKILEQNQQLTELNATKDKFFSIIAHDLRNPFNTILGFSELLLNNIDKIDHEKIVKYVTTIHSTGKNTYKLLENLLEWSRSQTGSIEFNPENLVIEKLISDVIDLSENSSKSKNITISCEISDSIIAFADHNMVLTVLRNLVSNAIKFTNRNGIIQLKAIRQNNKVQITVSDSGIGIDDKRKKNLFGINEKEITSGTENEQGTGLGLVLCQEFITKHKEKIWIESQVGRGSDFIFTLPLSQEEKF